MGKNPAFQFYPNDYLLDTRSLTPAAKGIWMDMLCYLHFSPTRGSLTCPQAAWQAMTGSTAKQLVAALQELTTQNVCTVTNCHTDVTSIITVMSRRMNREEKEKQSNMLRQRKHRGHVDVTALSPQSHIPSSSSLESSSSSSSSKEKEKRLFTSYSRSAKEREKPKTVFGQMVQTVEGHDHDT